MVAFKQVAYKMDIIFLSDLKIETIKANALQGPAALYPNESKKFDLIYSFGLFDYLPDSKLLDCANHFTPLLDKEGTFIFCLKDHRHYKTWLYEWLFDWTFYPRTFADDLGLIDLLNLKCQESFKVAEDTVCIYLCENKNKPN